MSVKIKFPALPINGYKMKYDDRIYISIDDLLTNLGISKDLKDTSPEAVEVIQQFDKYLILIKQDLATKMAKKEKETPTIVEDYYWW